MDALVLLIVIICFAAWLSLFGLGMRVLLGSLIGLGLVILIIGIVFLTNHLVMSSGIYLLIIGVILIIIGSVSFRPASRWEDKISKIKMYKEKE